MEQNDKFGFGSKPCMKEVPPGQHAVIKFGAAPDIIETEFGEKYSFPIVLLSHPSYDTLPLNMEWQSKSSSAKQLYNDYYDTPKDGSAKSKISYHKELRSHYKKSEWRITRFDNGAYWLEIEQ
ncbi:MAG: hypothetical protein [Circular genetic element sp.]|nr:MAG: hypothetical protein [Circular genetic element sp.]